MFARQVTPPHGFFSFWFEEFKVQGSKFKAKSKGRHELFIIYGWTGGSCKTVPKSSSGGTGFPTCVDRLAGAEARPTNLFMLYGWADRPMRNCSEKFS